MGKYFRHYKNKDYKYIGIARHSETLEELVVYEALYENKLGTLWVRPKDMFFSQVQVEGETRNRFAQVSPSLKMRLRSILNRFI